MTEHLANHSSVDPSMSNRTSNTKTQMETYVPVVNPTIIIES